MTFFHPSVRWTDQKPRAFVSARLTNQIALFSFICCFCFVRVFSFQGHTKIENAELVPKLNVFRGKTFRFLYLERQNFFVHAVEKSHSTSPWTQASNVSTDLSTKLMWKIKRFAETNHHFKKASSSSNIQSNKNCKNQLFKRWITLSTG